MRCFILFLLIFFKVLALNAKTEVLVSIAPQKFLVEKIGGEYVAVEVIVPPGANAHTYEPTPKQILHAQKGEIWFRIGESFEARLIPSLQKKTQIIDQREGLSLLEAGCGCCNAHEGHDPHIWLSPALLIKEAAQISQALSQLDPEHTDYFLRNFHSLENELQLLDKECAELLNASDQRHILVSHPAFGYFCRDYALQQLSIEMEGREPTPRYLTNLIATARKQGIKTVFLQIQHNPKGGKKIAKELGIQAVYIDPYAENVLENLRIIAKLFTNA